LASQGDRPWDSYDSIEVGERFQVKRITGSKIPVLCRWN
jgi:hypothetical protein